MRSPARSLILIAVLACNLLAGLGAPVRSTPHQNFTSYCPPTNYITDMVFRPQVVGGPPAIYVSSAGASIIYLHTKTLTGNHLILSGLDPQPPHHQNNYELMVFRNSVSISFLPSAIPPSQSCAPIVLVQKTVADDPCWIVDKNSYYWLPQDNQVKAIFATAQDDGLEVIHTEYDVDAADCAAPKRPNTSK